jgi:hypothetical protein
MSNDGDVAVSPPQQEQDPFIQEEKEEKECW